MSTARRFRISGRAPPLNRARYCSRAISSSSARVNLLTAIMASRRRDVDRRRPLVRPADGVEPVPVRHAAVEHYLEGDLLDHLTPVLVPVHRQRACEVPAPEPDREIEQVELRRGSGFAADLPSVHLVVRDGHLLIVLDE